MSDEKQNRRASDAAARLGKNTDAVLQAKERAIRAIPLNHHRFIVYAVDHVLAAGGSPTEDELRAKDIIRACAAWPGTAVTDSERRWLDSWWSARLAGAFERVQQANPEDPLNWHSRAERLACGQDA